MTHGRFQSTHDKAVRVYCCVRNNCFTGRKLSHKFRLFLKESVSSYIHHCKLNYVNYELREADSVELSVPLVSIT